MTRLITSSAIALMVVFGMLASGASRYLGSISRRDACA